ncbi:MAG: heme exporter protein CcmB [Rickettsiales bacterium]|nr:heme exporter protein CcmB [Rickettsiales bacterium]
MMQIFWIIFCHELLIYFRQFAKVFANFLFFIISVATFFLITSVLDNKASKDFLSIAVIWFSIISCLIFSAAEFLKKDFDDGTIEQILTSIDNFEIFILAKMLSNWLICSLPILISIIPIAALIGFNQKLTINLVVMIFLATLIINFICSFCGSLSILGNSAPLVAIIALPLIIPILLIALNGLSNDFNVSLRILLGLNIFLGAVTTFATAKIVKIAAE